MPIVVIGLSHHSSPVEVRERFAFADAAIPGALQDLVKSGRAEEAVILSTCNRVEIYAYSRQEPQQAVGTLKEFLAARQPEGDAAAGAFYHLAEPQSVFHLFKVACGLDSQIIGETEIFGQLKRAYDVALQGGHTGGRLNKLFQCAFNTAKHIRSQTNIQRGSVSIASVAVELAERIFSKLSGREVMVVGAGETSQKAARALLSRGARSIVVASRTFEHARQLAQELGGRAVQFSNWSAEFTNADIVISSTSAPHYILDRAKLQPVMKQRRNRPLMLIDIAVPRDIDPEVNFLENVYLYNIDDLQTMADEYRKRRQDEIARCEQIIREKVAALLGRNGSASVPGIARPAFEHE